MFLESLQTSLLCIFNVPSILELIFKVIQQLVFNHHPLNSKRAKTSLLCIFKVRSILELIFKVVQQLLFNHHPPTAREQLLVLMSLGQFFKIITSLSKFSMPNRHCHKLSQYFGNVKYAFNFNLKAWMGYPEIDEQGMQHQEIVLHGLYTIARVILHCYHPHVTIQIQFKFHQRNIGFFYRNCNPSQGIIIDGCLRRRAFHMPWVQMFGKHHQKWQQNMLIILFHNCYNSIPAYVFHDALQPFKP